MRLNGCPWSVYKTQFAALKGHFEVLKFAIEHGCECDEETMQYAASSSSNSLEVLKYLREHGCPWDWRTCQAA